MPNQYKPLPPLEDVGPHILKYWKMRMTDAEILKEIRTKHLDLTRYGLGLTKLVEMRKNMGLIRTRGQQHTVETIHAAMQELRVIYPKAGAREMTGLLFHERGMCVSRDLVFAYFRIYEADLIRERKMGRLRRRRFWAAGVNDVLAVDQHDKWKIFGLALHIGIDPFSGRIQWLKVWWNNNNPKLILSYYLEFIEKSGYIPLVTQSDPGSENYGIANAQTALRHWHDPNLQGTLQHRWMKSKKNVMPEISWSQFRRRFAPGMENILHKGVVEGWYNFDYTLHKLVFRWLFIPWVQKELDSYVDRLNNTRKRADRNKVLPHGVPNHINDSPEDFGCLDFKVKVDREALEYVRGLYAPPNDSVFELVPSSFGEYADILYQRMDSPVLTRDSIWYIYRELVFRFEHLDEAAEHMIQWGSATEENQLNDPVYELIANQQELPHGEDIIDDDGNFYMGGVNNGNGLGPNEHQSLDNMEDDALNRELEADFTDEEDIVPQFYEGQW